jgi:Reverse transcriptase (RNA-dependent DNA polymerase)
VGSPHHQRQGPQAAAAHPAGRRHHHPLGRRPTQISVGLRWKSGATQQVQVTRRKNAFQLRSTDPAAIELARRIGPGLDNNALAGALNDAGHRTGTGQPFDGVAAGNLRSYHHIPYPGLLEAGELTPRQVAQLIGVSTGTIHYWINAGYLAARRGPAGRWCIPFPPDVEAACRNRAAGSPHQHHDTGQAPRCDGELSIAEIASRLGVKPDVIYAWAEWGHPPAAAAAVAYGSTSPPTSNTPAWNESPGHTSFPPTSKPKPHSTWKGRQYEEHAPTVADRIAQTVVALTLQPRTESIFHRDSYGYRPGKSAHDALRKCRERCWRKDWVLDLDIRKFFDSLDHDLVVKTVEANTTDRWVLLYVTKENMCL